LQQVPVGIRNCECNFNVNQRSEGLGPCLGSLKTLLQTKCIVLLAQAPILETFKPAQRKYFLFLIGGENLRRLNLPN